MRNKKCRKICVDCMNRATFPFGYDKPSGDHSSCSYPEPEEKQLYKDGKHSKLAETVDLDIPDYIS